jgi:hypothetical protein
MRTLFPFQKSRAGLPLSAEATSSIKEPSMNISPEVVIVRSPDSEVSLAVCRAGFIIVPLHQYTSQMTWLALSHRLIGTRLIREILYSTTFRKIVQIQKDNSEVHTHDSKGLKRSSVALRHNDNTRGILNHRLAMSMRKCSHSVGLTVICEIARYGEIDVATGQAAK